ncbi:MAG TPA: metal-sensing transcriptional repressor [Patescibacteria group bacterium]|nr:metal-sensing transcriptional repressor [Patescibacteria group bacterium]
MKDEKGILIGLKKAHTHLGNVISMVEGKNYCVDIMQQNLAVIGLLKSANDKLFERHINHCFSAAMQGTNRTKKQKMIEEILKLNKYSN